MTDSRKVRVLAAVVRCAQRCVDVLVEGTFVRKSGERITSGLRMRESEPALVCERGRGEIGHCCDELRVRRGLDIGR